MFCSIYSIWFLLLLASISPAIEDHVIYINGVRGHNSQDCLTNSDPLSACSDIDWVFKNAATFDSTRFVLSEGTHNLSQPAPPFQNYSFITFEGNDSTIICTNKSVGLAFINVTNVSFYNIKFMNCGAIRNSTSKRFDKDYVTDKFKVSIYLESCTNITMEEVVVSSSLNATGIVLYDAAGNNTFKNCEFVNNTINENSKIDEELGGGGGGVYVELTFCKPGKICKNSESNISNAHYKFVNCSFKNNMASNWRKGGFIHPYKMNHQSFGRGGGLSLYIKGNNSNVTFSVDRCDFEENVALWGGGFFVELDDYAYGNAILVNNTKFISNTSPIDNEGGGGGLRLTHYIYELMVEVYPYHGLVSTHCGITMLNLLY